MKCQLLTLSRIQADCQIVTFKAISVVSCNRHYRQLADSGLNYFSINKAPGYHHYWFVADTFFQCWKATCKCMYSSTVLKYNLEVLVFYLSISILCYCLTASVTGCFSNEEFTLKTNHKIDKIPPPLFIQIPS